MESSYFLEIFGGDDLARPTPQREPGPVIDDLFEYVPAGTAADVLSKQLSDDELTSAICGLEPSEFQKSAQRRFTNTEHEGGDAFARSFEAHGGTITKADGRECWTFNGGSCECK